MTTYTVHPLVESGVIKGAKIVEKPDYCGLTIPCRIDVPCDCYFLQIRHQEALAQSRASALTFENQERALDIIIMHEVQNDLYRGEDVLLGSSNIYDSLSWTVTEVEQYVFNAGTEGCGCWKDGHHEQNYMENYSYRTVLRLVEEKEIRPAIIEINREITVKGICQSEPAQPEAHYVHVPYNVTCPHCKYTGKDNEFVLSSYGPDTLRTCTKCSCYNGSEEYPDETAASCTKNCTRSEEPAQPEAPKEELRELLTECVLRNNLALPSNEKEIKWFDEGLNIEGSDFLDRLYETLGIGQSIDVPYSKLKIKINQSTNAKQQALIAELWSLIEEMIQFGGLVPECRKDYERLKKEVETLIKK